MPNRRTANIAGNKGRTAGRVHRSSVNGQNCRLPLTVPVINEPIGDGRPPAHQEMHVLLLGTALPGCPGIGSIKWVWLSVIEIRVDERYLVSDIAAHDMRAWLTAISTR